MGIISTITSVIQNVINPYTPVDPNRILGIDISPWTGIVDFEKAKANGVKFVIVKASDGIYKSKYFDENWAGAKKAGLIRGAYCWLYPSGTTNGDPTNQAKAFWNLMKNDPGDLPLVVDFEWTSPRNPVQNDLYAFVSTLDNLSGRKTMIYTASGYWNQYGVSSSTFYSQHPLWAAQYKVSAPDEIKPFTMKIWQFSDRISGPDYGSGGETMLDGNYWLGTYNELCVFANNFSGSITPTPDPIPTPIPDPTPIVPSNKIGTGVVLQSILNVRTGPSTNFPTIGSQAKKGDVVDIFQISYDGSKNTWYRINETQQFWICGVLYYGQKYVDYTPVDITPKPDPVPTPIPSIPQNLWYVKDDLWFDADSPYLRVGLPATKPIYGGTGNINLNESWMAYLTKLNPTQMIYLTKPASGWHNSGDPNNFRELTFSGNVLKGQMVNGQL